MPEFDQVTVVVVAGCFAAAFANAAFAVGGAQIILATTSAVLPIAVAVPIHSALLLGSTGSRAVLFRHSVEWPIVLPFLAGAAAGAWLGSRLFFTLPEMVIGLAVGIVMLLALWLPAIRWRPPVRIPRPWLVVGLVHATLSTMFAFGAILQSLILHTGLDRHRINGTLGAALLGMGLFKIGGYALHGFDFGPYVALIAIGLVAGIAGTWLGKQLIDYLPETVFRLVFRLIITVLALRLIVVALAS